MNTAAAANETKSNIGQDINLAFELSEWGAEAEVEDVDTMTDAERWALNARMSEWWS